MRVKELVLHWVEVLPHPDWDVEPDAVVWIDPLLFDAGWMRGEQWVSPGGAKGAQGNRYPRAGEWIEAGNKIHMCVAWIEGDEAGFTDGRHRFAWLRDHGLRAMPMQVSPADADTFRRLFGTDLRVSILPAPAAPPG